jgi:predicted transcriptional regulator
MNELEILIKLDANSYRVYKYLVLLAGSRGVIHDITREDIMGALDIGENTVYRCLKVLADEGLTENKMSKKYIKILKPL